MSRQELEQNLVDTSNLLLKMIVSVKEGKTESLISRFEELEESLSGLALEEDIEIPIQHVQAVESGVNLDLLLKEQLQVVIDHHQKLIGKKKSYEYFRHLLLE
jgi:hypothetical protein